MSAFTDMLADDAATVFSNASEFGETITYVPATGASRTFSALIDRLVPELVAGPDTGGATVFHVFCPRSSTATVGISAVDTGGDRVSFPDRVGGTAVVHAVLEILQQDQGGWLLRCA